MSDVYIKIQASGGACEVATYTITDDEGTTLYSGTIASGGDLTQAISDATATLKNTSGVTISTTSVNAQGSTDITAPDEDIIVTDENDNVLQTITNPVYDDLTIELSNFCPSPVGLPLMKTGQTISYRTGDDGDLQEGRDVDFFTLASNNPFGNTNRFTDELGGSAYTNNIVIDWSTYDGSEVLGVYRNFGSTVQWNDAIDNALALSVGTYTSGWRNANIRELNNFSLRLSAASFVYAPIGSPNNHWSSTSYFGSSLAWFMTGAGVVNATVKTSSHRYFPVRTFTVTGTTLT